MSRSNTGTVFVLAVAAAVEAAALFYLSSDTGVSWAELGPSVVVSLGTPSGVVSLVSVAMPLAVVVFLFFTKPGRAFMQGLNKNGSN